MLSPLKPLLCRHDFYWSERHLSERCRRCGKCRAAEAVEVLNGGRLAAPTPGLDALPGFAPAAAGSVTPAGQRSRPLRSPRALRPDAGALKAQARERREILLDLLDRLAGGARPTREEAIDAVLAVIEDAHSADPVLFGVDAAGHFARLHEARSAPRC